MSETDDAPDFAHQQIVMLTHDESVRSTSLMLAVKFHVDTVIKDAQMYSQYKMEGRNMRTLDTDLVIRTAATFEHYIRNGLMSVEEGADGGDLRIIIADPQDPESSGD